MKKVVLLLINCALLIVIGCTVFYFFTQRQVIFAQGNQYFSTNKTLAVNISEKVIEVKREKPAPIIANGLYLTSYSASNPQKVEEIISAMKNSDLNAVVIDIKDYSGRLSYKSQVPLVKELQTDTNTISNITEVVKKFHDNNIYTIARQTVFQDPALTGKKPQWAVQNSRTGKIWADYKGLNWADASNENVWQYNLDIAKEAISLGFDEVNFDYIRFPSDGAMKEMVFTSLNGKTKAQVMASFFKFLYDNLKDEPAYISGDLFGLTTERDDDMNIGQQIEDAGQYFDYVCPMVYPSHYPSGYLDLKNPAEHPYEVITQAIKKGEESLSTLINRRAKIRPWLQAFDIGAVYNSSKVEAQIQASNENGGQGYLLWNARNVYKYLPVKK